MYNLISRALLSANGILINKYFVESRTRVTTLVAFEFYNCLQDLTDCLSKTEFCRDG